MRRSRLLILALIILLPLEIVLIVALLPNLPLIGQAVAGLLITCCVCGAIYVVALTRHHIALQTVLLRHADLRSRTIDANGVVVLEQEDGSYRHLSAEHEQAKLQLPAPVVITEEKPTIDRSQEERDILDLHAHGSGFKAIAQAYKDAGNPYWTEYRVRQVCNRERFGA